MKHHKKVFKNGLRLITVPMMEAQTVTVMVLVEAGSKYESKAQNGISHFLEHMCFKGTSKRTGKEITQELDGIGAESNAFTSFEVTGYHAKAHFSKLPKILDLVSDVYLNPTFSEAEIEKERGVIIEEIRMYKDLPQRQAWHNWINLLYGDQPAGQTVLGPEKNILSFKQKDFIAYHNKHYVAPKTTVVISGNFNPKEATKQIENIFGKLPKAPLETKQKISEKQKSPQIKIVYKKSDQAHLILGFRGFNRYDKESWTLSLAATILGAGFSSRLFQKLREDLGLCYYVGAEEEGYTDHGYFAIYAGVNVKKIKEAITEILKECVRIRDGEINNTELEKSKNYHNGSRAINLETSDQLADFYGFQETMHDKIMTLPESYEIIRKQTSGEIQGVLKKIMKDENLNFVVVGPYKNASEFQKILKL